GTYFQPFPMSAGTAKLDAPNTLTLRGPLGQEIHLRLGDDFQPLGLSGSGKAEGGVVFVGYGATAEKGDYDDFKGIDVEGKVVLVLRRVPRVSAADAAGFEGGGNGPHSALTTKAANAEKHKAAAILFVTDAGAAAKDGDPLMAFDYTAAGEA